MGIIYCAQNKINHKRYIGQTIQFLNDRIKIHKYISKYRAKSYFHKSISKYGIDGFYWTILSHVYGQEILNRAERFWIAYYRAMGNGYNHCEGGARGKCSEETKEKLRKLPSSFKGKKHTEEAKRKIREARKLQIYSEESKKKMSESHKGQIAWNKGKKGVMPEPWNKGKHIDYIPWNKGKTNVYTQETLAKMSRGHFGHETSEETRKKLRDRFSGQNNPFFGRRHTEATKRKISETKKRNRKESRERDHNSDS